MTQEDKQAIIEGLYAEIAENAQNINSLPEVDSADEGVFLPADVNGVMKKLSLSAIKGSVDSFIGNADDTMVTLNNGIERLNAALEAVESGVIGGVADLWYGIEFDTTVSSPSCTRIGNTDLHQSLPIQNRMKGCILNDNGDVVEYLDPLDWTTAVRDGSRGQVMVEIPEHYRKFETDGTKRRVKLSEYKLPGYHKVKKQYISAYEAALDRTNEKLASVVNTTAQYRGGNNDSSYDGEDNSLLGMPATNISRTNFRTYARNRKANSTEWNLLVYDTYKTVVWLFCVEYATLNSQAAYNAQLTEDGYKQGGLGAGVTTLNSTKMETFNSKNPFVPCGYTDSLGNRTGVVDFTMPSSYDSTTTVVSVPRYRGVENIFGHIDKNTDGINVRVNPETTDGGNGLSEVFITTNPSLFSDSSNDGYSLVGNAARRTGSITKVIFGEYGDIVASEVGGGPSTYFCDWIKTRFTSSVQLYGALFGGNSVILTNAGLFYVSSYYLNTYSSVLSGTRLCFIPNN